MWPCNKLLSNVLAVGYDNCETKKYFHIFKELDLFFLFFTAIKMCATNLEEKEFLPLCCQIVLFDSLAAISLFLPYKCNMSLLSRLEYLS